MTESDNDDVPELTAATAAALQEFLAEAEAAKAAAAARDGDGDDPFAGENWGLSQFWYTDETAATVASAVISAAAARVALPTENEYRLPRIACVACPSLFRALKSNPDFFSSCDPHLFEFDDRFERFAGAERFRHYDYREPLNVYSTLKGFFDAVVADPPYLSAECLKKTAATMRLLSASGSGSDCGGTSGDVSNPPAVLALLSGAVQRHRAAAYLGLRPVAWRPRHSKKLANEFLLMTDSALVADELGGFDEELPIDPVEDDGESDEEEEEAAVDEKVEKEGRTEEEEEKDEEGKNDP